MLRTGSRREAEPVEKASSQPGKTHLVSHSRPPSRPQVNRWLDAFSAASGNARLHVVEEWSDVLTAREQKWVVKIILKELGTGLLKDSVLRDLRPLDSMYKLTCGTSLLIARRPPS